MVWARSLITVLDSIKDRKARFCHNSCHNVTDCDRILAQIPLIVTKAVVLRNVFGKLTLIMNGFRMVLPHLNIILGCIDAICLFIILYKYHFICPISQFYLPPITFFIADLTPVTNGKYVPCYLGSTYLPFNISSGVIR